MQDRHRLNAIESYLESIADHIRNSEDESEFNIGRWEAYKDALKYVQDVRKLS